MGCWLIVCIGRGHHHKPNRLLHAWPCLFCADVLLVMPQRRAPSEALQRAAAEAAGVDLSDEDEGELRFSLRPDARRWEKWLAQFLQVCSLWGLGFKVERWGFGLGVSDEDEGELRVSLWPDARRWDNGWLSSCRLVSLS